MPQTGATRYQKFLKSEKSKTKLKAKKELPKGTNVTKTNFKVKKIVIKEQLKKHGEFEALSTRKLTVKELLSRLNHFNTHTQTDALDGLKELISSHSEVLDQNLSQLILGVTPLLLNIEKIVRRESLKVLHLILSNISEEKIDPFFDILSTYLRSAMTHIDSRIQEDSLLFLDILLLCVPQKVAQDFHKIVPNFLDMISKLRVDSKPGRTLTVNLDSQITTVKWRVKVLHRLHDFLKKFIEHQNAMDGVKKTLVENTFDFDATKMNHYNLFNTNYTSVCYLSCFSSKNLQDSVQIDEVEKFKEYTETLMPLLFETWLEVCPTVTSEQNIETVVNEDAAILLKYTLEVITLLWTLIQHLDKRTPSSKIQSLFCHKYKQSFNQHFVQTFPFVTNVRSRQSAANSVFEDTITDPKLIMENLGICYLFIMLNPFVNIKNQNREITSVLNYIEKTFNKNTQDEINDMVIKILNSIFSNELTSWTKSLSVTDALFRKIIWAYFNKEMPNSFKQKIFTLLCKIALNDKLTHFYNSVHMHEKWLNNLPDILLEDSITSQTVEIIHKFATHNCETFNAVIKSKLLQIIVNLPKLRISDSTNDTSSYHRLFSIFYWIKSWDNDSLNLLEKQLLDNVYRSDHGKYIFDMLKLKSGGLI